VVVGLVINKEIYHGKCFATEIGHATINFNGPKSRCGNNGCLESYVSIRGILSRAKGLNIHNPKELFEMVAKGNKKALDVWEETGFYLGIGITNIINTLNPDIIVIGGQIANAWPYFNKKIKKTVKERALFDCKIVKKELKDAGILGAALLVALNSLFNSIFFNSFLLQNLYCFYSIIFFSRYLNLYVEGFHLDLRHSFSARQLLHSKVYHHLKPIYDNISSSEKHRDYRLPCFLVPL